MNRFSGHAPLFRLPVQDCPGNLERVSDYAPLSRFSDYGLSGYATLFRLPGQDFPGNLKRSAQDMHPFSGFLDKIAPLFRLPG
jgi:hypothetical protein